MPCASGSTASSPMTRSGWSTSSRAWPGSEADLLEPLGRPPPEIGVGGEPYHFPVVLSGCRVVAHHDVDHRAHVTGLRVIGVGGQKPVEGAEGLVVLLLIELEYRLADRIVGGDGERLLFLLFLRLLFSFFFAPGRLLLLLPGLLLALGFLLAAFLLSLAFLAFPGCRPCLAFGRSRLALAAALTFPGRPRPFRCGLAGGSSSGGAPGLPGQVRLGRARLQVG